MRAFHIGVLLLVVAGTILYLCFFRRGKQGLSEVAKLGFTAMLGGGSGWNWRSFAFVMSILLIFFGVLLIIVSEG